MRTMWVLCGLLLTSGSGRVRAQQSGTQTAENPAKTREIRLTVEVTDKSGHPVSGLRQNDFTVLDNGRPVPLDFFYAHAGDLAEPGSESLVLVMDAINVDFNMLSAERTQVETFLRSNQGHLSAPVSIAAVTETELNWITETSADGNLLAGQLDQWQPHLQPHPATSDAALQERWQESIEGFDKILRHEAERPGRKVMIWISPGWPFIYSTDLQTTDTLLHQWMDLIVAISTNLREAQVTLEVVEPEGSAYLDSGVLWRPNLKPVKKWDRAEPADVTLQVLAIQSGGQVVHSSNDVASEIAKCVGDATAWYTLTIAERPDKPNTWHDLQVRVDQPDVVVRAGNGYYAQPQL